jgi:phenylalanyl-tRNA synthetase alpha chain
MKSCPLPIAKFIIGKTFRHEAIDVTHDFEFMQCEGILVDKNVTLSNLFAVAKKFLQKLFRTKKIDIRIRPGYFPFVEPGVEIDMRCPFCKKGCTVCKKTRWIEVFPAGLIHPNVLKFGGIDSKKYSGFAFGFGLTRLIMLRHNINDIRLLHSGKIKFLEQF